MQSLKFAHLVKEHTEATIYDFYIDMRTAGKGYDEFYQRILEEGGIFVRGKPAEITDVARTPEEEGKLILQVEDTLVGQQRRFPVDMVILSSGSSPAPTPRNWPSGSASRAASTAGPSRSTPSSIRSRP
jgi:heterodisulfide reductase subunit A